MGQCHMMITSGQNYTTVCLQALTRLTEITFWSHWKGIAVSGAKLIGLAANRRCSLPCKILPRSAVTRDPLLVLSGATTPMHTRAQTAPTPVTRARRLPRRARCPLPPALPPLRFPSDFSHSIILSIPMYSSQLQIYFCTAVAAQCTPTAKLGPTSEVLGRVRAGRLYSRWLRSPRAPSRSLCGRWLCCAFDGLMHVL